MKTCTNLTSSFLDLLLLSFIPLLPPGYLVFSCLPPQQMTDSVSDPGHSVWLADSGHYGDDRRAHRKLQAVCVLRESVEVYTEVGVCYWCIHTWPTDSLSDMYVWCVQCVRVWLTRSLRRDRHQSCTTCFSLFALSIGSVWNIMVCVCMW